MATTSVDSANLILKLYELRREETMRKARDFMFGFNPNTLEEFMAGMMGPNSAYVRMVVSYWEMACSFVVSGAIDASMFGDTNGEHIIAFGKIEPFLTQLRAAFGNPEAFKNLEKVATSAPSSIEKVRAVRERMRGIAEQMKAGAAKA